MALPDFSKFKAPYRFVPEGDAFRLYENGEKTRTTFKTMAEAKKKVLALNNAWRASPAGRKATPNKKYDAQGHVVRKPARRAARANPRRKYDESRDAAKVALQDASGIFTWPQECTCGARSAKTCSCIAGEVYRARKPGASSAAVLEALEDVSRALPWPQECTCGAKSIGNCSCPAGNVARALRAQDATKSNPRRKYDESRDAAGYRALSDLKKGEFFKRKADARKVYRKGDYDRAERKFVGMDEDDISRTIYLKGSTMVYVGFDY